MERTELIEKIEEYAGLFLSIEEISILCDLDPGELRRDIRDGRNEIARAYLKGKTRSMVDIRKLTVEFAKKGSPQAEVLCKEYIEKMESYE